MEFLNEEVGIMANDNWGTPNELFNVLNDEFNFSFDAACTIENSKCSTGNYFDLGMDALEAPWHMASESIWLNPPYSRGNIYPFMQKAYMESLLTDKSVVCLVRDDPTARWYKNWVDGKALEVRRLKHRLKFVDAKASYPFPCCVVIYNRQRHAPDQQTVYNLWSWR